VDNILTFYLPVAYLNQERRIQIYLPKNYENSSTFSVLYFHDGQNIFDAKNSFSGHSWEIKAAVDKFYQEHQKGVIVVAVDNAEENRLNEYSPWKASNLNYFIPNLIETDQGGLGKKYNNWFVETLVPFINNNFKTNNNNLLIGSSMGGYISLYIGYKNPEIFSAIISLSTAIWFNKKALFDFINKNLNLKTALYLDVGTAESSSELADFPKYYLNDTLELKALIDKNKLKKFRVHIEKNARHSEIEWQARFPHILNWLNEQGLIY
jgi:predicted alpha/beta superfamily hydrolase